MYEYLFGNREQISLDVMASAINYMEPRVTVSSNDIQILDQGNSIIINIKYKLKAPNDASISPNQVFTVTISGEDDGR